MSNIKKAYQPIMSLLAANMSSTVEDIYEEALALTVAQTGGGGGKATTFHRDEDGNVVAIRCGYFGLWFLTSEVEFGAKKGSASGFNTMCKEGVSLWNKQQTAAKKAKEQLLSDVASGEVDASDIAAIQEEIEAARNERPEPSVPGFETLEEALAA